MEHACPHCAEPLRLIAGRCVACGGRPVVDGATDHNRLSLFLRTLAWVNLGVGLLGYLCGLAAAGAWLRNGAQGYGVPALLLLILVVLASPLVGGGLLLSPDVGLRRWGRRVCVAGGGTLGMFAMGAYFVWLDFAAMYGGQPSLVACTPWILLTGHLLAQALVLLRPAPAFQP